MAASAAEASALKAARNEIKHGESISIENNGENK